MSPEPFDALGVTEQKICRASPFTATQCSVPIQITGVSGQRLMTADYASEWSIYLVSTLTNDSSLADQIFGKYGTKDLLAGK